MGRINQWDDPYAIYHRPETRFVAEFVGEGIMLKATANDSGNVLSPLGTFSLPKDRAARTRQSSRHTDQAGRRIAR